MDIQFYGDVDKDKGRDNRGNNASEYPAWYLETHMEELKESIASRERRLKRGEVFVDSVPYERQELAKEKQRLEEIERTKPKLSIGERQKLVKFYRELGDEIQRSMFTYSDMMKGVASPHEEAKRMTEHLIPIDKELIAIAGQAEVRHTKGKVSRNGAAKLFKLIGKLIGEPTNIEVLRRDEASPGKSNQVSVAA